MSPLGWTAKSPQPSRLRQHWASPTDTRYVTPAERRSQAEQGTSPASPLVAPSAPSESHLMAELRDLGATEPPLTLELARAANQRFRLRPHAAERTSHACTRGILAGRSINSAH